jgi:hypothetical protein
MRPFLRFRLTIAAACSVLVILPAAAWADDGTLGGLIGTTNLIGTLGGINLPQIGLPDGIDPTATDPTQSGTNTTTTTAPAPTSTTTTQENTPKPVLTHALGYYCKGESKRHVKGQKRTPFSQCVTAMGKLSKGSSSSATAACRGLPRRRVSGARSTPYALCVAGGKNLLADLGK